MGKARNTSTWAKPGKAAKSQAKLGTPLLAKRGTVQAVDVSNNFNVNVCALYSPDISTSLLKQATEF